MSPVRGSRRPTVPLPFPVNQMLPSRSLRMLCGVARCGSLILRISPVLGSSRPTRLAEHPGPVDGPSASCRGSRTRCPSVGAIHSLIVISVSPGTSVGRRSGLGGKLAARYSQTVCVLRLGQPHHRGDEIPPALPIVAGAAGDERQRMTRRAHRLRELAAGSFGKRHRLSTSAALRLAATGGVRRLTCLLWRRRCRDDRGSTSRRQREQFHSSHMHLSTENMRLPLSACAKAPADPP